MRWDNLFADLEGQLEHELGAEDLELRVEEERLRLGRLSLRDRMRAVSDPGDDRAAPLLLWLADGSAVRLRPATFGRDWVSGELVGDAAQGVEAARASARALVPLDAVASISLTEAQVAPSLEGTGEQDRAPDAAPRLIDRLGLAFPLRDLARRRSAVTVTTLAGDLHGTIDRVARDHVDLALHEPGAPRRAANVRGIRIVPMTAVVLVRI
ncbi:hypothetical protein [Humibacter sp. RRB41]|uniref:hypothetical protein n=1 Tax=Humibacter sp. RRB41 TaxID=2919946 RepID=UPI001FAA16FA|nr:hypothetical protein [Humibacter sp. RRB41]